jgi:hypothetical protein
MAIVLGVGAPASARDRVGMAANPLVHSFLPFSARGRAGAAVARS